MNNVNLLGRLATEPELRQTQSGISSCRFTIAVNRKFKNQNGEYDADFITCVAWKQTAEFVSRYFNKGSMIAVSGSLRTGSYTDKHYQDVTHYTTDVYVDNVEFTGEKKQQGTPSTQNQQPQQQQQPAVQDQSMNMEAFEEILNASDLPF